MENVQVNKPSSQCGHLCHIPCIHNDNDSSNSHLLERCQTIFPSSLGLVTLIWLQAKQDGCTMIKLYLYWRFKLLRGASEMKETSSIRRTSKHLIKLNTWIFKNTLWWPLTLTAILIPDPEALTWPDLRLWRCNPAWCWNLRSYLSETLYHIEIK